MKLQGERVVGQAAARFRWVPKPGEHVHSVSSGHASTAKVPPDEGEVNDGKPVRRISRLLPLVLILAGAILVSFPYVANLISSHQAGSSVIKQHETVATMSDEQRNAELDKAREYNNSLIGEPVTDPFIPGSGVALPGNYESVLNVNGDGVIGSVDIDMIDVHLPIGHGTDEDTLQKGTGHIRQSSLPIGGKGTHAVIAAHRGLPHAEMFTRLDEMKIGDTFTITVLDEKMTYQVDRISVVEPDDLSKIAVERDKDLVTLMTCTPYGVNSHRLLVRGTRIPNEAAPAPRVSMGVEPLARLLGVIIGLTLMLMLLLMAIRRRMANKDPIPVRHRAP